MSKSLALITSGAATVTRPKFREADSCFASGFVVLHGTFASVWLSPKNIHGSGLGGLPKTVKELGGLAMSERSGEASMASR